MNEINASKRARMAAQEKSEADKILVVKQAEAEAEAKCLQVRLVFLCYSSIFKYLTEEAGIPVCNVHCRFTTVHLKLSLQRVDDPSSGKSSALPFVCRFN